MKLLLNQESSKICFDHKDFKGDIEILMADEDVQFKVKTLTIWKVARNQLHILDWLLLKSPNLKDFTIYPFLENDDIEGRCLEI